MSLYIQIDMYMKKKILIAFSMRNIESKWFCDLKSRSKACVKLLESDHLCHVGRLGGREDK